MILKTGSMLALTYTSHMIQTRTNDTNTIKVNENKLKENHSLETNFRYSITSVTIEYFISRFVKFKCLSVL